MTAPYPLRLKAVLVCTALIALTGCENFDFDMRDVPGIDTSDAARNQALPPPQTDERGVISYPTYQVAVARRGDTVSDVAARVGLPPEELSSFNAIPLGVALREGEVLALPRRVEAPTPGATDISAIAGSAIARADGNAGAITAAPLPPPTTGAVAPAAPASPEPLRHQVQRGETAYSIARLYNVSPRALAEWNGLGPDLSLREGQYLMIPLTEAAPATVATVSKPGELSSVPVPPSASRPLPAEKTVPAAKPTPAPPSPDLKAEKTVTSQLAFPVSGKIIRGYEKKKNEGIDIAAAPGTTVQAAKGGTVAAITRDTEQVPILVIRHDDNLLTVYANIDNIKVAKGDTVTRGQPIATLRAGDPAFLHFEVRQGFESVDPMPLLQ